MTGGLIKKFKANLQKINKVALTFDDGILITVGEEGAINVYLMSNILANKS